MRVSSISNLSNSNSLNLRMKTKIKRNEDYPIADSQSFKGIKGASIGAGVGVGYLALASILSGPFLPITASWVALSAGVGALAGHNVENEFSDKNNKK